MGHEPGKNPILIVEPTDPNHHGKVRLLRLYPILNIAFNSTLILVFFIILQPPESILLPLALIITASIIWGIILYFIVRAKFAQYIHEIIIYEDGLKLYPTFLYGPKDLNGFIGKDRISEIRGKGLKANPISGPQVRLSIMTNDGNSRVIGIRSIEVANQAIEKMRQLWGVKTTLH